MRNPFKKSKRAAAALVARQERQEAPQPERPASLPAKPAVDQKNRRFIGVLISPHQTEKATAGSAIGWYTFRVAPHTNKGMVRRAVGERYGVSVERVRMLASRSKAVRLGRISGRTPGFKKAMVKVKEGQTIEFM